MFKSGDIVRCIDGVNYGGLKVVTGNIYTVLGRNISTTNEINLEETPDNSWLATRFELVSPAKTTENLSLPTVAIRPFPLTISDTWLDSQLEFIRITDEMMQSDRIIPNHSTKCECGVDAIGGGKHSSWCPKHD